MSGITRKPHPAVSVKFESFFKVSSFEQLSSFSLLEPFFSFCGHLTSDLVFRATFWQSILNAMHSF